MLMLIFAVILGIPLLYFWIKMFKNPDEFSNDEKGFIVVLSMFTLMLLLADLISWIERYKIVQPW